MMRRKLKKEKKRRRLRRKKNKAEHALNCVRRILHTGQVCELVICIFIFGTSGAARLGNLV